MVTIYGARSTAEVMIARVRRIHDMVAGTTPSGEPFCARDPELLNWVQGTEAHGLFSLSHLCAAALFVGNATAIMPRVFRPRALTMLPAH